MREIVSYLTRLRLCQDKIEKLKQREVNVCFLYYDDYRGYV